MILLEYDLYLQILVWFLLTQSSKSLESDGKYEKVH